MRIAVTAASGALGAETINQLQALGLRHEIIGIARTVSKVRVPCTEIRQADYNDFKSFVSALKDIDQLVIIPSTSPAPERVKQHENIIQAAIENSVNHVLFTSIATKKTEGKFNDIIGSLRQTEQRLASSGLGFTIARNGVYLEPDLEYIQSYIKDGAIINCAGEGKCAYTSRPELGYAYARILTTQGHKGQTYNLCGIPITQHQLAWHINEVYHTQLVYQPVPFEDYQRDRKQALGDELGDIIAGIYHGLSLGSGDIVSDFSRATGRAHMGYIEIIRQFRKQHQRL